MFTRTFRNLITVVAGQEPDFAIEHRLFNVASFFITSFALIASFINYSIGLEAENVWLSAVGGAASLCLFYIGRFRQYFNVNLVFCYVFLSVIILGSMYFYSNGMNGTTNYVYMMMLNIFVLIMPPRYQYWVFSILFGCVAVLLALEYTHPEWVIPYHSNTEKFLDHGISLFYCMLFTSIVVISSRKNYYRERQKTMQQNAELMQLNQHVEEQRQALEDAVKLANQRRDNIEVLLNELNHRVKNNLQVVCSLLKLQAQTITDEKAKSAVLESKNRLSSIILVHKQLYLNEHATRVFMPDYLQELTESIMLAYFGKYHENMVEYTVESVWLPAEKVVPVGRICNELITNSFKHNAEGVASFRIEIKLAQTSNQFHLVISDNGTGFTEKSNTNAFGLQLVRSLVKQLNGTCQTTSDNGTSWDIKFS
jgi:two-component sensor histidine kinase